MKLLLLAVLFFGFLLLTFWLVGDASEVEVKTEPKAWGTAQPFYVIEEPPTTTTAAPPLKRPIIRATQAAEPVVLEGSINGYPCGPSHGLPPCYVLRRESLMAADPPRVWNGNCYMPVGSLGQCGRSSASGLWQVLRSTWGRFGGFVNAADAPVEVQNEFARQLWRNGAGCSHWRACR